MKDNITDEIINRVKYMTQNKGHLIADGDTHPSDLDKVDDGIKTKMARNPNYYQGKPISTEQLIKEMDMAGVDMCISWQNPAVMVYEKPLDNNYETNFNRLLAANRHIYDSAMQYPERIIPCGWTDPKALGMDYAKKITHMCVTEFGFPIVKMNPAQNEFMMDSPEIQELVNYIVSLGATPAFHFGGDTPFTPPESLRKIATLNPDHPLIAVHMGGGGAHYVDGDRHQIEARNLGLKHPNIFYILSAKRDCHIESDLITYQLAGEPFFKNIACGSDAPYGKVVWNYGGFRAMFSSLQDEENHTDPRITANKGLFTDDVIQNYMGRNLINLVIRSYKSILKVHSTKEMVDK